MKVAACIHLPQESDLKAILKTDRLDIVSPFYSGWTLGKLKKARHKKVRFITRLPKSFRSPPPMLENDPKPLLAAMKRLGGRLDVYALPAVHAKLYLSAEGSWLGSSNFTRNGFSGKEELLVRFDAAPADLTVIFSTYRKRAKRVTPADVEFLVECVQKKLTRVRSCPPGARPSAQADDTAVPTASLDDFVLWAKDQGSKPYQSSIAYVTDRLDGLHEMRGHAKAGFAPLFTFLGRKPKHRAALFAGGYPPDEAILADVAAFVAKHGASYKNPIRGDWRTYLPKSLNGNQNSGGAARTLVKHYLVALSHYMHDRSL